MIAGNGQSNLQSSPGTAFYEAESSMTPLTISQDVNSISAQEFQINPRYLLAAFRRRWFLSIFLGSLLAVPVGIFAWKYTPTPFRAEAEVKILASRPRVNFQLHEDAASFRIFKSTQIKNVLHPKTLIAALEEEEISQLPIFRNLPSNVDHIHWLRANVSVRSSGEEYFSISMEGEDPKSLAKLVNAVKNAYIKKSKSQSDLKQSERFIKIDEELARIEKSIEVKEKKLKEMSKVTLGPTDEQMKVKNESLQVFIGDLNKEIRSINLELIDIDSKLNSQKQSPEDVDNSLAGLGERELLSIIELDDRYVTAESKIGRIQRKIQEFKRAFNTENLPEIVELKADLSQAKTNLSTLNQELREFYIGEIRKRMVQNGESSLDVLKRRKAGLENHRSELTKNLNSLKLETIDVAKLGVEIQILAENLEAEKTLARSFRSEKRKIEIEDKASDRIISSYDATIPAQRETKKRFMFTAGGSIVSLGLVIVIFTLIDLQLLRVNSLEHLKEEFRFPILGTIPNLPGRFSHSQETSNRASYYQRAFTESIDTTRTMLLDLQKKTTLKAVMLTSAMSSEGKSTLCCHLAISFARAGRRTLLIDGDMRSPTVHDVFQTDRSPGFCEALRDETSVSKCLTPSPVPNLDLMPAGKLDANALRSLAGDRPGVIMNELREAYDIIVLDSAPMLPVTDSLLLLPCVDGIIISVRKDVSRISKIRACLGKIQMLGGRLLGGVVIGIDEGDYGYHSKYS